MCYVRKQITSSITLLHAHKNYPAFPTSDLVCNEWCIQVKAQTRVEPVLCILCTFLLQINTEITFPLREKDVERLKCGSTWLVNISFLQYDTKMDCF